MRTGWLSSPEHTNGARWVCSIGAVVLPGHQHVFDSLISRSPAIADATRVTTELLPGGLSNTSYVVDADDQRFVVRIGCDNADVLGIDRSSEVQAARFANEAGFAPETLVFTQPEGHSVTRYLPDVRPLTIQEFVAPETVLRVAARMRDVHALPRIGGVFDPFAVFRLWLPILHARGTVLPHRLDALLADVARAERQRLHPKDSDLVVCHNDPYHLNFLDDGSLWLIDWEYAGMGDPMYDLAGVGHILDSAGRDLLLHGYFGDVTPEMRRDLDALIPVFLCWNVMWCLIQFEGGVPGFDYRQMAEDYLDGADET
jgi:thiamine kinase-like enzyme